MGRDPGARFGILAEKWKVVDEYLGSKSAFGIK
jgi:hypothetical protein